MVKDGQGDWTNNINGCNTDICNKTKDKRWVDNTINIIIIGCIGQIGKKKGVRIRIGLDKKFR